MYLVYLLPTFILSNVFGEVEFGFVIELYQIFIYYSP